MPDRSSRHFESLSTQPVEPNPGRDGRIIRAARFFNRRRQERPNGVVIHLPHASCYTDELFDFDHAIEQVVIPVSPSESDDDPCHRALTDAVGRALRRSDHCLILGCYSFPSSPDRPDICLGKDWFHTPNHLVSIATNALRARGWRVAVNTPYAGALVPSAYYKYEWRVQSLMIEVNRSLYMDERTGARLPSFENFREGFQSCLRQIIAAFNGAP